MKLSRRKLRNILYENYLQVLLEGINKQSLLSKYAKLDVYEKYLDKLHPKYYKQLGNYFDNYNQTNDDYSYGLVMYLLLMHQKYAKTKYIPAEAKDFNNTDLNIMKSAIESFGAQYTDRQLYKELQELDIEVNEIIKKEIEAGSEEDKADFTSTQQLLNKAVRPGLVLLKVIEGWQVLLPTSVQGSKNIGVSSWCTVYSDAWQTYKQMGITLYYFAKDGKDYNEKGYGFDHAKKPFDYLCLGFNADGSLNLNSTDYGTSVWGNQKGVNIQDLNNNLGQSASNKIVDFLKKHYKLTGGSTKVMDDKEAHEKQREMEINKRREAIATIPRIFKLFMRDLPPDVAYTDILGMTLEHPSLNDEMVNFIIKKYILKIDSKIRRTSYYKTFKSEDDYKSMLALKLLQAHVSLDSKAAELCLGLLIKVNGLDNQIQAGQAKDWGVWANKDISRNICQYLENRIEPDLFTSIKLANKNADNRYQYQLMYLIRQLLKNDTENMFDAFEEAYSLGKYDSFINFWSTEIDRKFD